MHRIRTEQTQQQQADSPANGAVRRAAGAVEAAGVRGGGVLRAQPQPPVSPVGVLGARRCALHRPEARLPQVRAAGRSGLGVRVVALYHHV